MREELKSFTRSGNWFILAGVGLLLLCLPCFAQNDTAMISGQVTDQTGDVLVGAQVQITNVETDVSFSTVTNSDGVYIAPDLRPGPYRMAVDMSGFRRILLTDLILNVQDSLGRNFIMEVGRGNETTTVKAGREEWNISPSVSTVVDQQFVDNLPLNGRSFQSLIQLTPGVLTTPSGQMMEGQFSINGQRADSNYFMVDGVSANFSSNLSTVPSLGGTLPALTIAGGTNTLVSADAMQEFRIETSSYSAEFGRSAGGQISIITKSGTNKFHGTAYDYLRNDVFDARNWFNRPPEAKPPLRQNDFGGTMGGPILKDRTFFFFSYEGLRLREPTNASDYFFTKEARAAASPVYQPLLNALPLPNGPLLDPTCDNITKACIAALSAAYSNPTSFDAYSLRIDQALKQRTTLFVRYNHTPSNFGNRYFSLFESDIMNTDIATAGVTIALGPNKVNDFRANWSQSAGKAVVNPDRSFGAVPPPPTALFPPGESFERDLVSVVFYGGQVEAGTRVAHTQRQLNFVDGFSLTQGTHLFKFGVDYRRLYPISHNTTGFLLLLRSSDFTQVRDGTMGFAQKPALVITEGSEPITTRLDNWSLFAQDSWKMWPRLNLTYGLRWELNTPPVSTTPGKPLYAVQGVFDSSPLQFAPPGTPLWHASRKSFAPRLGASYELSPSTVLRGGFGLYYDVGASGLLGNLISGFPYFRAAGSPAFGQPYDLTDPIFLPPPVLTSLSSVTNLTSVPAFDPNLRLPRTWHWNATFERQLGSNQLLSLTYAGARGQELLRPDEIFPPELQGNGAIIATRNAGRSHYDALQAQFRRDMHGGLQALISYCVSKSSDTESDNVGNSHYSGPLNVNFGSSLQQVQIPPPAPSDFDIRHSFSAAVSYEVPSPHSSLGRVGRVVLKDWAVDGIVRASSSPPLNVRIGGYSDALPYYLTQPNVVPGQPMWLPAPGEPSGKILNPDAFTLPAELVLGNFRRNSLRSPFGVSQTDIALGRRFRLGERISLDVRVEYFNLFNHPMFGGPFAPSTLWGFCASQPCTGQQDPEFGRVTPGQTLNQGLGGGGVNGGQSPLYAIGGPRSAQFTVKVRF